MAVIGAIRRRFFLLLRSEHGMALPTALFALIASFGFATAAILSSVTAQRGTHRDSASNQAIAAADAGADVALMRMNRFLGGLSAATPCISPGGIGQVPDGTGWCPWSPTESVGTASFRYRVSAFQAGAPVTVVAVGTHGQVSRRVEVGLISYDGENVFSQEQLIGEAGITLDGTPYVDADIGTNGDVDGNGTPEVCGDIRHGVGKEGPDPDCGGEKTEGHKTLPPLVLPEGIATNNWNCRLSATIVAGTNCDEPNEFDPYIGANGREDRTSKNPWEAGSRTITVDGNSTLTMGGGDYFVCRVLVKNGQLIMPANTEVRVFFDTPEKCGLSDGAVQLLVSGNASIISTAYNGAPGSKVPGFYLSGSSDIETQVVLSGNAGSTNQLMIYAPKSDVSIEGKASWIGMIAGDTLTLNGTPTIKADADINPPAISYAGIWERTHYVECSGAVGYPAPDSSC